VARLRRVVNGVGPRWAQPDDPLSVEGVTQIRAHQRLDLSGEGTAASIFAASVFSAPSLIVDDLADA